MISPSLDSVVLKPQQQAAGSVIWLHGLGADGHDFADIVPELHLPESLALRFIFPHAPVRPVAINGNIPMRAWFDIYSLSRDDKIDSEGMHEAMGFINEWIEHEIHLGIPANKIVLAGFSQGGAMALYAGLRYPKRLAGILALSTFLPLLDRLPNEATATNRDVPIFIAHGDRDQVLVPELGKFTYENLKKLNYPVEWHEYSMAHQVCAEELMDIQRWFLRCYAEEN